MQEEFRPEKQMNTLGRKSIKIHSSAILSVFIFSNKSDSRCLTKCSSQWEILRLEAKVVGADEAEAP